MDKQSHAPFSTGESLPGNNLPLRLSSFVGRDLETAEVKGLLLGGVRLLTLTGPGGCGKSRLALKVAGELTGTYPDGVWWVGLAPLVEPDLVARSVAQALGVRDQPDRPLVQSLVGSLRDARTLILLDNCEHLVGACARLVHELLTTCPKVHVIATSREPLGVSGELTWVVPSLSIPDRDLSLAVEDLSGYGSLRLFVERATERSASFAVSPDKFEEIAEICRRLDGIPLAIELAAARVGTLSLGQILERLDDSLRLLTGGERTAEPRQRTLRGTLEWSYKLLDGEEKVLFQSLCVFRGGWSLEAAEAVAASSSEKGDVEGDVLDLLAGLVDKSLVAVEANPEGTARYRMLEPVRQFAQELCEESGRLGWIRERHAAYYAALAVGAEPELLGPLQETWLARLEREHDNLRAVLEWSLEGGDADLGVRLAGMLGGFWYVRGYLNEGRRWLERVLAESESSTPAGRAKALNHAGWMALYQGDLDQAIALFDECLRLFREAGVGSGEVISLTNLGHAVLHKEDRDRLSALREEAEALRRESADGQEIAELLVFLGMVALYEGDTASAVALLEESMRTLRHLQDEQLAGETVVNAGRSGGPEDGTSLFVSLELVAAQVQEYLWMAALEQGDFDRASDLLEEELRLEGRLGNKPKISFCLLGLAVAAALRGQPGRAVRLWGAAETMREEIGLALVIWDHTPTDYEGLLAATRSQLDAAALEAAQADGRTMTWEQILEYALGESVDAAPHVPAPEVRSFQPPYEPLTARELEVLGLISEGLSNREIANRMYVAVSTVKTYVSAIFRKLDVNSRTQAIAEARRVRLLSD